MTEFLPKDYTLNTDIYKHVSFILLTLERFLDVKGVELPIKSINRITCELLREIIEENRSYEEIEQTLIGLLNKS